MYTAERRRLPSTWALLWQLLLYRLLVPAYNGQEHGPLASIVLREELNSLILSSIAVKVLLQCCCFALCLPVVCCLHLLRYVHYTTAIICCCALELVDSQSLTHVSCFFCCVGWLDLLMRFSFTVYFHVSVKLSFLMMCVSNLLPDCHSIVLSNVF